MKLHKLFGVWQVDSTMPRDKRGKLHQIHLL